jgi:GrpB-like predicted nucleotidyltransferase (UPF0157 family)
MTITLVQPYSPAWPTRFMQVRTFLQPGLSGIDCTIEHVGSTAIPGMVAKPIIDLIIVMMPGAFPAVKTRIENLGYVHQGDLGIPGREAFDLVDADTQARLPNHHLYVCEEDARELRKQLAFRDFMREHPEWREKLSRLKSDLCVKHYNDRQAYMDGKASMVEEIAKLAMMANSLAPREGLPDGSTLVH